MGTIFSKENIKKYYNQEAGLRNSETVRTDWKAKVREQFCNVAKQEGKKTLLELGAGAGYDSQFFMGEGLSVIAVDLSGEMVKNCKAKGIEAYELDYYDLSSLNRRFDCVYAINTLLHVPKKELCHVLNEISNVLGDEGLFYMGVYGGDDTENEYIEDDVSDTPRFFAFYSEAYLKSSLAQFFEILNFEQINVGYDTVDIFYSIIMRKRQPGCTAV